MASKKKEEEPPRNVPIITVRQQYTTKCGETCGGQGFGRDKQYPPCGPSPPSSTGELTCGLKDCMETDTCRCRCHCALRELMRQRAEEAADPTNVTSMTHETVIDQQVPLVHKARILTLDPSLLTIRPSTCSATPATMDAAAWIQTCGTPAWGCERAHQEQMALLAAVGRQDSIPSISTSSTSTKSSKIMVKKPRPVFTKVMSWWQTYGGLPPEPCRGKHCFFGSPERAFNTTAEVLGDLPEWNLPSLLVKKICHIKCPGRVNNRGQRLLKPILKLN